MARLVGILLAASAGLIAGCNDTETGAQGLVRFTPDDCGQFSCDFDDGLVAGGTTEVFIMGTDGVSTAGLDLASDDEGVFTVQAAPDEGTTPRWELFGAGAGVARLTVLDRGGQQVDFLEVFVQELDGMQAVAFVGSAVGPDLADPDYDEVWTVNADQLTSFFVRPTVAGQEIMGKLTYQASVSQELAGALTESADPAAGFLEFSLPVGQHDASFTSDNGTTYRVLFDAQ